MTATKGLGTYGNGVGTVTPLDHKMAQLGSIVKTAANTIRAGLFWDGSGTVVSGKANMSYDVRAFSAVLSRGATAGAVRIANDAVVNVVTTAAPGSNSRYDVVYLWQREFTLDGTDSNPVIGVTQGTAAASPTVPSLAAFPGAIELARILVPAGVTATNSGTTITQTAPFTSVDAGVVPFRNTTEMGLWTSALTDQRAYDISTGVIYRRTAGATWVPASSDALVCRVTRSSATPAISNASFTDLSTTANWTLASPGQNLGFATYSNGITIPLAGVYEIGYSVLSTSNIGVLAGITINDTTVVAGDLRCSLAGTPVQSAVGLTCSTEMLLAANDVLRLYAIAASGAPTLTASVGEFYATWKRAA